ncbi:MAG: hypothetical protein IH790_05305 [Acidobacteria bacterium]|nr:hypothetical protein [Acidobacteriota bacterium]
MSKQAFLREKIEHLSLDSFDPVSLLDGMAKMSFQARNTASAAAHEIGLPSNVCPSTKPGFSSIGPQKTSAMSRRQIIAEIGA